MNFFKVVSALTLILIIGYVSINQSSGQMGPGQNGCYHNGDFYNVATGPECPSPENENDEYTDPSGNKFTVSHAEYVAKKHNNPDNPDCFVEMRPLL